MKVEAVVVGAGASQRFGGQDKLLAELCGRPVIEWSLAAIAGAPSVERVVVVVGDPGEMRYREAIERGCGDTPWAVVRGGQRRRDSVQAGLEACTSRYVAIHDAARPLVTLEVVERTVAAAEGQPGAIAAVPVVDTIKEVHGGVITGHPDRSLLWAAQTPQVVLRQAWLDAAAAGDNDETDDAAMLARLGLDCVVAEGDPANMKITRPEDLTIAAAALEARQATR